MGEVKTVLQSRPEVVDRTNNVVSCDDSHDAVRVAVSDDSGRPCHGIEGVTPYRLAQNVLGGKLRQQFGDGVGIRGARAHQNVSVGHQAGDPLVGHPKQTDPVDKFQQLFGLSLVG